MLLTCKKEQRVTHIKQVKVKLSCRHSVFSVIMNCDTGSRSTPRQQPTYAIVALNNAGQRCGARVYNEPRKRFVTPITPCSLAEEHPLLMQCASCLPDCIPLHSPWARSCSQQVAACCFKFFSSRLPDAACMHAFIALHKQITQMYYGMSCLSLSPAAWFFS